MSIRKPSIEARALVLLLVAWLAWPAGSSANFIVVGPPSRAGTKFITVIDPKGKRQNLSVPLAGDEDAAAVRSKIIDELTTAGIAASETPTGAINVAGQVVRIDTDTGEVDEIREVAPIANPFLVSMALGGTTIAAVDSNGGPALYTARFALSDAVLGDITLESTLSGTGFTAGDPVQAVIQAQYDILRGQLASQAPSLLGYLSLDLGRNAIDFYAREGLIVLAVTGGTTDVSLSSTVSLEPVPEPASLLLAGTGLLALVAGRRWRAWSV